MTSMTSLISGLFRQRNRNVYLATGISLLVLLVTAGYTLLHGLSLSNIGGDYGVIMTLAMIAMLFILAVQNERVWTHNSYRLIPISDTKLYIGNMIATILSFIYFSVIQIVILIICNIGSYSVFGSISNHELLVLSSGSLLFILSFTFVWVFISMVNLILKSIAAFLPEIRQRLFRVLISLGVVVVVLYIFNTIEGFFGKFALQSHSLNFNGSADINLRISEVFGVGTLYFAVIIVIMSLINIYLLEHWVETKTTTN